MNSGWNPRWLRSVGRTLMLAAMFVEAAAELLLKRPKSRVKRAEWLHRFCARSMRRMGVTTSVHGSFPTRGALITNHQSYLDIVVLASISPCVFVSKAELASVPVVGWMTTMAGSVFVERGRGESAVRASAGMKVAADAGLPVVFFPEGTTGNKPELLPFRSGLLAQVLASDEPITAGFIHYSIASTSDGDVSVEENVCWGELPMFTHIFRFLGLRGVHAEVRFAPTPIVFSSDRLHRKAAAMEARLAVAALAFDGSKQIP